MAHVLLKSSNLGNGVASLCHGSHGGSTYSELSASHYQTCFLFFYVFFLSEGRVGIRCPVEGQLIICVSCITVFLVREN